MQTQLPALHLRTNLTLNPVMNSRFPSTSAPTRNDKIVTKMYKNKFPIH